MNLTLYFGIMIYMSLTSTVAAQLGIAQVGTASSLVVVILALHNNVFTRSRHKSILVFKGEFYIVLVALMIMTIKFIMGEFDAIKNVLFFLIVPMLVSVLLKTQTGLVKQKVTHIILFVFIAECLLALYERAFLVNIFQDIEMVVLERLTLESMGFRSTAFYGHPLANALSVSTIMGFILTTPMKLPQKMLFIIIGYSALLCFNARAAILIWTILLVIYFLSIPSSKGRKHLFSLPMVVFFILAIYVLYEMIINQGYGDRLFMADTLFDGSAMARLEVFDAFSYVSSMDFWLGNMENHVYVMHKLGAGGVENGYVVMILNYGIAMALILFVAFFFWLKQVLIPHIWYNKIIIITSFVLVGSTNNALASASGWMFFVLCANVFLFINKTQNEADKSSTRG
jgi:hypothetical protein